LSGGVSLQPGKCGTVRKIFFQHSESGRRDINRPAAVVLAEPWGGRDPENLFDGLAALQFPHDQGLLVCHWSKGRDSL
jgi:hypothetical protein